MKKAKVLVTLFLVSLFVNNAFAQCDPSLWAHVYHSNRLIVQNSCMTVSGTVYSLIYEDDGDIHIRVTLDTPYTYMLNSYNYSGQKGKLVCEPLCATTCVQADAIAYCAGFTNTVYIPAVGEHVLVTGSYVTDDTHGWNEIHPVTSIVIGNTVGVAKETAALPEITVYPNPAVAKVHFKLSEKPSGLVYVVISDEIGRLAGQYQMRETQELEINTRYLPAGKYYYNIKQESVTLKTGNFVVNH